MPDIKNIIVKELEESGPVSKSAAERFGQAYSRILSVIEQTVELESENRQGERGTSQMAALLRSNSDHFGRSLEAVYRYSLWGAMVDEAVSFALLLSKRELSGYLSLALKSWIIAITSSVRSPEVYQLTRPLEILRKYSSRIESAAEAELFTTFKYDHDFVEAILDGDAEQALSRTINHYRQSKTVEMVLKDLLYPAMAEIGTRWRKNSISVAQEHAATSTLRATAQRFFDSLPASRRDRPAVAIACVPGDEHELGAELTALYLASAGWRIYFIGRSAPEAEIIRELGRSDYFAVLLSVSMIRHLPAFERLVSRIRRLEKPPPVVAGGGALRQARSVMSEIADETAATLSEAREVLTRLEKEDA